MNWSQTVVEERITTAPPPVTLEEIDVEVELRQMLGWMYIVEVCLVARLAPQGVEDPEIYYSVYTDTETQKRTNMMWTGPQWSDFLARHLPVLQDKLEEIDCGYPAALDRQLDDRPMVTTNLWTAPAV